jgi:hypothetical protein
MICDAHSGAAAMLLLTRVRVGGEKKSKEGKEQRRESKEKDRKRKTVERKENEPVFPRCYC